MDAGPHANDPELRELTLALLAATAADPHAERTAELLDRYLAAVERRRGELADDPERLDHLELDHALVILDGGESAGLGSWDVLADTLAAAGIDAAAELRRMARQHPDPDAREAARKALRNRGIGLDDGPTG